MAFQLRERNPPTLEDMQSVAVSVEANLLAKRARVRNERMTPLKDETSPFDQKMDALVKGMEKLMDRIEVIERKPHLDSQQEPRVRNPNFRKNQNQNIGKNEPDQNIRPHFQENFDETSHQENLELDTQINLMGLDEEETIFLTHDDQELYMLQQLQTQTGESFDYKQGYDSAIFKVHKQYNLRSKKNTDVPDQNKKGVPNQLEKVKAPNQNPLVTKTLQILSKPSQNPPCPIIEDVTNDQPSKEKHSTSVPLKETVDQSPKNAVENPIKKTPSNEKEEQTTQNLGAKISNVQIDKSSLPFNLGAEVAKLKISVPLIELVEHETYRSQIRKSLNFTKNEDSVNLFDDQPELIFEPDVNGKLVEGGIPPFYISLNIHDKILHNTMLDPGASHNLIPKSVMEKLNLDITRPYKDLFSFDSSQVN